MVDEKSAPPLGAPPDLFSVEWTDPEPNILPKLEKPPKVIITNNRYNKYGPTTGCPKCADLCDVEKRHNEECKTRFRDFGIRDGWLPKPDDPLPAKDAEGPEVCLHNLTEADVDNEVAINWPEPLEYPTLPDGEGLFADADEAVDEDGLESCF